MDTLSERADAVECSPTTGAPRRARIVVIGAGFAGLAAVMRLARADIDVTVIDRRAHHLFQPLLYQVATAALSPADIAAPIRSILSHQANVTVTLGTVTGIDVAGRAVLLGERRIRYDQLIVATGAREAYFGHDEWAAVTSGLKSVEDASSATPLWSRARMVQGRSRRHRAHACRRANVSRASGTTNMPGGA
jgi:NADH:quinone reductase (non-electrogenic)